MNQFLQDIFLEFLGEYSIIPLGSEVTLTAMRLFGGYDLQMATLIAALGMAAGGMINYGFGYLLSLLRRFAGEHFSEEQYDKIAASVRRFGFVLLPFWWLPFGVVLPVFAGFFHMRWYVVLPLLLFGAGINFYII
jgi:membrane protein YqaA with SNARE-associated domain